MSKLKTCYFGQKYRLPTFFITLYFPSRTFLFPLTFLSSSSAGLFMEKAAQCSVPLPSLVSFLTQKIVRQTACLADFTQEKKFTSSASRSTKQQSPPPHSKMVKKGKK